MVLVRQFRDEKLVETKGEEGCKKQREGLEKQEVCRRSRCKAF